jgi:ATP-dependent Zn protease
LSKYRPLLDKISLVLLEKETLEGEEFTELTGLAKANRDDLV